MRKVLLASIILLLFSLTSNAIEKTELVIISAMHGAHNNHPTFDYKTLYNLVDSFEPDFVGIEIRQEDIKSDPEYLKNNYPKEMVELSLNYKSNVFGFDWLGESIEGMQIPNGYWSDLKIKKLSKAMNKDNGFLNKEPKELSKLRRLQSIIIKQATPSSLNNGEYGRICREIDKLQGAWYKGSQYFEIIEFDKKRDTRIGHSIIQFIEQHQGSRIVLVMGADHRTFAIENIDNHFGNRVKILSIK